MNKNWQHIMHSGLCPTIDQLVLYFKGKLPKEESMAVENHLASCEICNDLLEGLAELKNIESLPVIEDELRQRLHENLLNKKTKQIFLPVYQRIAIAASILLIIGISFVIYRNFESPIKPVAQEITQKPSSKDEKNETLKESSVQHSEFKSEDKKKLRTSLPAKASGNSVTMSEIQFDENSVSTGKEKTSQIRASDSTIVSLPLADNENKAISEAKSDYAGQENSELKSDKDAKIEYDRSLSSGNNIINGRVIDENGSPLPGVNIVIKGTTKGVVTDIDGKFTITLNKPEDVLNITYVGYKKQELTAFKDANLKITLEPEALALNEVVVVGYGVKKKSMLTGAVTSIDKAQRKKVQATKVDETLKGKASGITIKSQEESVLKSDTLNQDIKNLKSIIEKHLELKNKNEALENLFELNTLIKEETEKKEIEDIIQLTKEEKYSKALKKLKKLK